MHQVEIIFRTLWKKLSASSILKEIEKFQYPSDTKPCDACGNTQNLNPKCSLCITAGIETLVGTGNVRIGGGDIISSGKLIAMLNNYKSSKYVYEIDNVLNNLLKNSSFKDIPMTYLKMPKGNSCVFVINNIPIFLTLFEKAFLGIAVPFEDGLQTHFFKIGDGITLSSEIDYLTQFYKSDHYKSWTVFGCKDMKEAVKLIINTLFYILGDKDVVAEIHPGVNPKKMFMQHRDPIYGKQPTVYNVGQKYRKLVERYELDGLEGLEVYNNNEIERSVRPHVRSAHFHLYWTGEGRKIPIVKFLMSCLVNGHVQNFTDMEEDKEPDLTEVK